MRQPSFVPRRNWPEGKTRGQGVFLLEKRG
jgi:hypothetical protein